MNTFSLNDKYTLPAGRISVTGPQVLVRLALDQHRQDLAAGLNTAGFISGYRGSPLGGFDTALGRAAAVVAAENIKFVPGVNEELAATAVYGSQQTAFLPGAKYDGVFAIWYGKGPGVDRAGDALKHGNLAGSARHGGVLVLAGDDHGGKSSTTAHQSEPALMAAFIPILYPATLQEYYDFGLWGIAMSRYAGLWVAMKCVADTADSLGPVVVDRMSSPLVMPTDFVMPADGLSIRDPDTQLQQEARMVRFKLAAAQAFCRANGIDRVVVDSPKRSLGVITAGKAYLDVMQALRRLGIDQHRAAALGLRVYKVGLTWPLERQGLEAFAAGHTELLVVEEKRHLLEQQVRDALYAAPQRPIVSGKIAPHGEMLLPSDGELDPDCVAVAIEKRLVALGLLEKAASAVKSPLVSATAGVTRTAYFCSGCPHNTSTRVPDGSRALAGIGCHVMASMMPHRSTLWPVQMGGEGANWIGAAPFLKDGHVFQNLGDGTYFHSGLLAIRAAVAADVSITYKILFNDAVAMTGGQAIDGTLTVPGIATQLLAEGVRRVVIVADDIGRYRDRSSIPAAVEIFERAALDRIQRDLALTRGVTVLIYDQMCAAEKRRRRKRGMVADPPKRMFINELVCEGCGDCGRESNCVSIQPLETEFGRKRVIDQSSCNKDYSCSNGFCPSFVTVSGGSLVKPPTLDFDIPALPPPVSERTAASIVIAGIGGTGVVTVGAVIAMAAHLEGRAYAVMDMTGLSQKNGAVMSHVRIASRQEDIHTVRLAAGEADVLLGCDLVVAAGQSAVTMMKPGSTAAIVNTHLVAPASFTQMPDLTLNSDRIAAQLRTLCDSDRSAFVQATHICDALLGDSIGVNMFLLGFALQRGLMIVGASAIEQAIGLNGVAVEMNLKAFRLGRWTAFDSAAVETLRRRVAGEAVAMPAPSLDAVIASREAFLSAYQNAKYARRYRAIVDRVTHAAHSDENLVRTVAQNLFKLMAYKDEYEVARLYTEGTFLRKFRSKFQGNTKLQFHLAPPLFNPRDARGKPRKLTFGPWMFGVFKILARLRWLRGTIFDPFGRSADRVLERRLILEYEDLLGIITAHLTPHNIAKAVALARTAEDVRGFGHVKVANVAKVRARQVALLADWRNGGDAA